jgi:hypothetical protein
MSCSLGHRGHGAYCLLSGYLERYIPIILCTGFSHIMAADHARAAGMDAQRMKPKRGQDLALTIRRVLGQRGTLAVRCHLAPLQESTGCRALALATPDIPQQTTCQG